MHNAGLALLGAETDMNEASSLSFENDIVDVYSNSWGPFDDGYTVSGPEELTKIALENGINHVCDLVFATVYIHITHDYIIGTRWKGIHLCMG